MKLFASVKNSVPGVQVALLLITFFFLIFQFQLQTESDDSDFEVRVQIKGSLRPELAPVAPCCFDYVAIITDSCTLSIVKSTVY